MLYHLSSDELQQVTDPQWDKASSVHDWRNYIPIIVREWWADLGEEAKQVAFIVANEEASEEVWD